MEDVSSATSARNSGPEDQDLERLKLENEKLRLEIEDLRGRNKLENRIAKFVPAITALIAIAGLSFGVYQFQSQQRQIADQRLRDTIDSINKQASELARSNEAREQEFRKPFWEKQLQLYFDATEAASTMATSKDARKRELATEKFWSLYWGPLAVVEDAGLEEAPSAVVEASAVPGGVPSEDA